MTTNSYSFDLISSTNSSADVSLSKMVGVGILTSMLLASVTNETGLTPPADRYAPSLNGTFSQYQNAFTGDYATQLAFDFEASMTNFYANLLARQEPLGADFEKILYDNLWDLYGD